MVSKNGWKYTMYFYFSGDVSNPQLLKDWLDHAPERKAVFKEQFDYVMSHRPISFQEWEDEMNASYDDDDEMYRAFQNLYRFLFQNPENIPYRQFPLQ